MKLIKIVTIIVIILAIFNSKASNCDNFTECEPIKYFHKYYLMCNYTLCLPTQPYCYNGEKRCQYIYDNEVAKKMCMVDTCYTDKVKMPAGCSQGMKGCKNKRSQYQECLKFKDASDCEYLNEIFWQCVTTECLGSVDEYIIPFNHAKSDTIMIDMKKNKLPNQIGLHNMYSPPKVKNRALNPASTLQCRSSMAAVKCRGSSIASCTCSDGSNVRRRKGY